MIGEEGKRVKGASHQTSSHGCGIELSGNTKSELGAIATSRTLNSPEGGAGSFAPETTRGTFCVSIDTKQKGTSTCPFPFTHVPGPLASSLQAFFSSIHHR